jgi:archaellum component FlaC
VADEPDNLTLVIVRRLDAKFDRFSDDLHNVKIRLSYVEENLAGVNRRLDRFDARLDQIEKRLDLVEPHQSGFRE